MIKRRVQDVRLLKSVWMSNVAIGKRLGISESTVRRDLIRAKRSKQIKAPHPHVEMLEPITLQPVEIDVLMAPLIQILWNLDIKTQFCCQGDPTKTLAKLGNAAAKKNPLFDSVADLRDEAVRTWVLDRFAVGDVWGVGGATAAKLAALGIHTAGQLRDMPMKQARAMGTVVPSHLMDADLFDFKNLTVHTAVAEGDIAFDEEPCAVTVSDKANETGFTEQTIQLLR